MSTIKRIRIRNIMYTAIIVILFVGLVIFMVSCLQGCESKDASAATTTTVSQLPAATTAQNECKCAKCVESTDCGCDTACACTEEDCHCGNGDIIINNNNTINLDGLLSSADDMQAEIDRLNKENAELQAEIAGLKAENDALRNKGNSGNQSSADAAAWKAKYEDILAKWNAHKCDHTACNQQITQLKQVIEQMQKHVCDHATCKAEIDKLNAEIAKLINQINQHVCSGSNSGVVVDHTACNQMIAELRAQLEQWKNHKCPAADHSNCGGTVVVQADHSNCVSKREYDALAKEHSKCSDHSDCISAAAYNQLVAEFNAFKAEHKDCGECITIVEADHSSCVSLKSYNELLAKYNAAISSAASSTPIYVDPDGNVNVQ